MMHSLNIILGGTVVAGLLTAITAPLFGDPKFMTVRSVDFSGGTVIADRWVQKETVADWQVVITPINDNGPVCVTEAQPDNGIGWAMYSKTQGDVRSFTVDEWVGQEGCWDQLSGGGKFVAYHLWNPRDGSPPVEYVSKFEVTK